MSFVLEIGSDHAVAGPLPRDPRMSKKKTRGPQCVRRACKSLSPQ
jgi:hypothetical protein